MLQMTARGELLASTVMASAMALAIGGVSAAQTISTAEPGQATPPPAFGPVTANTTPLHDGTGVTSTQVQEVVVTGSRIPQPNLTSISPVVTVGSQEAKLEGTTRVEDLVNSLPQAFAAQTSSTGVGATGTATLNLRNLGADRTLVLIDGKRLGPGDPQNTMGYAADVNLIPAPLISRVEVLTGGASATYGSDAVAGVVNFIVRKDFQGVRLDVTGGGAISDNDNHSLESIVSSRGINYPTGTQLDAGTVDVTALLGANAPDGKGNITAYAGYRHQAAVIQSDRDYGACSFGDAATQLVCSGSGITNPAHLLAFNPTTSNEIGPEYIVSGAGGVAPYDGATESFNTAPFKNFERPDERYTGGFFGHYDISPGLELYSSFMFMDDQTSFEQAPSGLFGQTFNIPCNNPLFSATEVEAFCKVGGLGPADSTQLAILRRNLEGGPRELDLRHTDYRINIGARGDLGQNWRYDTYLQYYEAGYSQALFGEFSLAKAASAFNVVQDPDGTLSCATGVGAGCVPYNIFTAGGVTQAALNYLTTPGFQQGSTTEQIASASVTGDLGSYGVRSPYASNGVGIAFGTEYRREALTRTSDNEFLTGDLSGSGGQVLDVQGSEDLYELFTELRAPLAQDLPFVKSLTANAGYRFSDYSTGFDTNTFKVGGDYAVTSDILMRGSYNHAIRAPNLLELASPQVVGVDGSIDPCANDLATGLPDATLAQCERTGITPSQYGHISASSSAEYNGLTGGNPELKPEVANTETAGFVLTPRKIPHLSISADYYDISNYPPPRRRWDQAASVAMMVLKGLAPGARRAVSITVRTSASPWAAHMAR